jgi:hypothetical protein
VAAATGGGGGCHGAVRSGGCRRMFLVAGVL